MPQRLVIIILSLLILILGLSLFYTWYHIPKLAYINSGEIYNDFELKKELEKKLESSQNAQKKILDSLYSELQILGKDIRDNQNDSKAVLFQAKKQQYIAKDKEFTDANKEVADRYSDQIWKKLNQYIDDYGTKHNYTFIIGASGNGTLMHGDIDNNITDKVKAYVNQRYKGAIE